MTVTGISRAQPYSPVVSRHASNAGKIGAAILPRRPGRPPREKSVYDDNVELLGLLRPAPTTEQSGRVGADAMP